MVINHWDLLEDNIHVDIQTGTLGILLASSIGGAEAGPFAVHLWGLENILGIWKTTCMAFCQQHDIRRFFWNTLLKGIGDVSGETKLASQTARLVGIFMVNDFYEASDDEQGMNLAVLELMTLNFSDRHREPSVSIASTWILALPPSPI